MGYWQAFISQTDVTVIFAIGIAIGFVFGSSLMALALIGEDDTELRKKMEETDELIEGFPREENEA